MTDSSPEKDTKSITCAFELAAQLTREFQANPGARHDPYNLAEDSPARTAYEVMSASSLYYELICTACSCMLELDREHLDSPQVLRGKPACQP